MSLREFISGQFEADFEKHIPYAGHISPTLVQLFGGAYMLMYRLRGVPFELALNADRNGRVERINTMLRAISDPDLGISIHLVRHQHTPPAPQPELEHDFTGNLLRHYREVALDKIYTNDWYISVLIYPPFDLNKWKAWLPWNWGKTEALVTDKTRIERLEDAAYIIERTLADYRPQRLGIVDVPAGDYTIPITEIGTALYLIRTAKHRLIPHTSGTLAAAIYTETTDFGRAAFRVNPSEQRYGAMISFLNYPARTRPGMLNSLLSAEYPLVLSHSFRYRSGSSAISSLALTLQQMEASGDRARTLMEGLESAMDRVASLKTAEGLHHFGLAVYADSLPELDRVAADARHLVQRFGGASPVRDENVWHKGALPSLYFSQLPGSPIFKPRPGKIDTANIADLASLDNYPLGEAEGHWGASPIRFRTNGGTAYDWTPHNEDVAHTLVIGRTGSGKTVLLGTTLLAMQSAVGPDGVRLLIDKDESNRLTIEAAGGTYQKLLRNQASGLAPLVAFSDSPRTRAFFHRLYSWLIGRNLTNLEDERLTRGIARQLSMPPEKRSMWGIREFLGYEDEEDGAGARFEKWCSGRSMGWLLDNKAHTLTLGSGLYGIDFTELLPREGLKDDSACTVAATIITHQLGELMDGRRIVAFFDECRFYIEPLASWIEDLTLTGRKKEVMPWLVFQEAAHATESSIGQALVSQMRTKIIFPDASYNVEALEKLQLSPAAIRMLKEDMTLGNARRFLLWRPHAPAICEFDLSNLPELPILSGRSATILLWEQIRAKGLGAQEFIESVEAKRRAA